MSLTAPKGGKDLMGFSIRVGIKKFEEKNLFFLLDNHYDLIIR